MQSVNERVVLFGSEGGFSPAVLNRLLDKRLQVVAVVMPAVSRQHRFFPVAIEQTWPVESLAGLAALHGLEVLRYPSCTETGFVEKLEQLKTAYLLVACFPCKLPASLWESSRWHCWNLHPSLLPKYRGPDPLFWQIQNHETETGITLHQVTGDLDAGDIIGQRPETLPVQKDAGLLNAWVAESGVELFVEALEKCRHGQLVKIPQDAKAATYYPKNRG